MPSDTPILDAVKKKRLAEKAADTTGIGSDTKFRNSIAAVAKKKPIVGGAFKFLDDLAGAITTGYSRPIVPGYEPSDDVDKAIIRARIQHRASGQDWENE